MSDNREIARELLPCPFCGADAVEGTIGDETHPDFDGRFIQCSDGRCGASTSLRFACGDDPAPLLREQWNRRDAATERGRRQGWSADDIRAQGWVVAVHNDYRQSGEPHTFWLFTKGERAIKGEGRTDAEALDQVRAAIAAIPAPPAGEPDRG